VIARYDDVSVIVQRAQSTGGIPRVIPILAEVPMERISLP
jgi:hypothetical protein